MSQNNEELITNEHPRLAVVRALPDVDIPLLRGESAFGVSRERRRRWPILIAAAAVAMTVALASGFRPWGTAAPRPKLQVLATVPYWNLAAGSRSVVAHGAALSGASPWIYSVGAQGDVISQVPEQSSSEVAAGLARLQKAGVALMPTISNTRAGSWDSELIGRIIDNPRLRARHVQNVVAMVDQHGFAGVDIDYENLLGTDRGPFTAFITELAQALHSKHKKLSVDVFAKTSDRGYDQRNVAQDYAALGAAADEIRIMAYDWHWSSSVAGPIAPLNWVNAVLRYAVTEVPASKIILGIPTYGYDWVGKNGTLVSWIQAYNLVRAHHAVVHWDDRSQSPWFTYRSGDGKYHTVWFENAYSAGAKIGLMRSVGVGGLYLWLAGDEDSLIWSRISGLISVPIATKSEPSNGRR